MADADRERDVIDLLEVGVPRPDVARRFGLSEHQIRRIEFRHKLPPPTAENITLLLQAIRTADDPLRTWPAVNLIHALGLPFPSCRRAVLPRTTIRPFVK